jgi:hypothetical protein
LNVSLFSWVVILLAVIAANLPFFNQQLFALVPLNKADKYIKPIWIRLLELLVLYFLVGLIAYFLETSIGNAFPQGWQFYTITACLFLVLAYPGYVLRYLRKRHG